MGFEPEITEDLDEPFTFRSGAVLPSYLPPSVVGVDGRAYLMDTKATYTGEGRYRREGIDVVQQRNTSDQRDVLLLPQGIWRQSVQSWHQGAGQSNMDRDNALPYRFSKSYGIDPWTWWQISLLNTTVDLGITPSLDPLYLVPLGANLVSCQTTTLKWYTTIPGTPTDLTVGTNTILDAISDGYDVITLHSDGKVYKSTNATTTALYQTHAGATFIGYNKDYLIVGAGNVLKNITGTAVTVFTHPQATFTWVDSCDGNSCIYALGGSNEKWVIHRIGIKNDGTGLLPNIVAATLPDGEIGYSIGSYLGFVFIGTNKGVRMAAADGNGDLTLGALIPTDAPVYCFEGQDKYVWYGNSSMDGSYDLPDDVTDGVFPTIPAVGLGRMDLSTFTVSQLTPAYANDLVATGVTTGNTRSVVTFNDKRVFSIDDGGVFYETDDKMTAGWLENGIISYSVEDAKTALYMQTKWEPLTGRVLIDVSFDSGGQARYADFDSAGSISSGNISLNGTTFSRAAPRIVLMRDAVPTTGPVVTRWEMRVRPTKGKASRWTLPIMNFETVEIAGANETRDPLMEYDRLMALVESGVMFSYSENKRSYQVVATDFQWMPVKITESGNAWEGVYTLIVEEVG